MHLPKTMDLGISSLLGGWRLDGEPDRSLPGRPADDRGDAHLDLAWRHTRSTFLRRLRESPTGTAACTVVVAEGFRALEDGL
ncbi:MAG TPA: hypothetical protein VMU15_11225 [Anaeromyxobacter sp.]|nr:hypothetical protein [Anaeromyxobacter sp.]